MDGWMDGWIKGRNRKQVKRNRANGSIGWMDGRGGMNEWTGQ